MTFLNLLDLVFQLVLGIVDRLTYVVTGPVGFFRSGLPVRLIYLVGCVLHIAPGLLYGPLGLIDDSLVGEFVVADRFADALLDFSNGLIDFSGDLILIHDG